MGSAMVSALFCFLDDAAEGLPSALLFLPSLALARSSRRFSNASPEGGDWVLSSSQPAPVLVVVSTLGVPGSGVQVSWQSASEIAAPIEVPSMPVVSPEGVMTAVEWVGKVGLGDDRRSGVSVDPDEGGGVGALDKLVSQACVHGTKCHVPPSRDRKVSVTTPTKS